MRGPGGRPEMWTHSGSRQIQFRQRWTGFGCNTPRTPRLLPRICDRSAGAYMQSRSTGTCPRPLLAMREMAAYFSACKLGPASPPARYARSGRAATAVRFRAAQDFSLATTGLIPFPRRAVCPAANWSFLLCSSCRRSRLHYTTCGQPERDRIPGSDHISRNSEIVRPPASSRATMRSILMACASQGSR